MARLSLVFARSSAALRRPDGATPPARSATQPTKVRITVRGVPADKAREVITYFRKDRSGSVRSRLSVKFRYPRDGLGPVAVRRSRGVDAAGPSGGVGEGAALAGGVVTDGMRSD